MSIQLIIFDLDGTLIDSRVDITNALNYALKRYAFAQLSVEDTVKMIGEGISRLIEKVVGEREASIKADVTERFLTYYTQHILDYTREYPGVRDTLEKLGSYQKAVISNKNESLSKMVLKGLGLLHHFNVIIGSDTTPERKPSPLPILRLLTELHVQSGEAVIVGDSNYDVDAGKAAGITTVAVTYGYRPREVIAHADYLIDTMTDLVPLLRRIKEQKG
ncbi:MAG TPA: HAD-IA family hydrolase [Thermodesulfovibrionales bacterium]|nr:HAD-IA family hydrolase [Thermodesulfovibrionales bacterium]